MQNDEARRHLIQVLGATGPNAVHTAVISHLESTVGGVADILLVDYEQRYLRSTSWPNRIAIEDTAAGRAYLENTVVVEENRLWVPLDSHGAGLGVLSVVGENLGPDVVDYLSEVATLVARALIAAERTTDVYRRLRRSDRMTLAAELQWSLLPGRGLSGPSFTVAGQLEPALSVRGDSYDWSLDDGVLTVMACNGMGDGVTAALLTTLCVAALRNSRRSGLEFEEQVALASDSIWAQYGGKQYSEAVVLRVDVQTGRARIVDAGSPRLYRLRGGRCERVPLDAQMPLGMFDGTRYDAQLLNLRVDDRLVLVSDGVVTGRPQGTRADDADLSETIARTADLTPAGTVRALIQDVWLAAGDELSDDAVVVCLDWHG